MFISVNSPQNFLQNLRDVSDGHFHQDFKVMKECYDRHWDKHIIAD